MRRREGGGRERCEGGRWREGGEGEGRRDGKIRTNLQVMSE